MKILLIAALTLAGTSISVASTSATSSASAICTTSTSNGACAFAAHPKEFQGTEPGSTPEVDQNVWNSGSPDCAGWSSTLTASSAQDWSALVSYPLGNSAVCAFTNAWAHGYDGTLQSYPKLEQNFTESFPHNAGTTGWAMDDLWFNSWGNEVMIQYDFSNNGPCQSVAQASFAGQAWHLCVFGTQKSDGSYPTEDWKLGASDPATSESSGTIHIKAMVEWLETNGYLPVTSTWTALSAGFEICSTPSPESFGYSRFNVRT